GFDIYPKHLTKYRFVFPYPGSPPPLLLCPGLKVQGFPSELASDRRRVANISCTFRNVNQPSDDSIARQRNESPVISEKIHLRDASGAKSPSRTISSLICRAMKGRTQPLAGPIQVDLQASILGS